MELKPANSSLRGVRVQLSGHGGPERRHVEPPGAWALRLLGGGPEPRGGRAHLGLAAVDPWPLGARALPPRHCWTAARAREELRLALPEDLPDSTWLALLALRDELRLGDMWRFPRVAQDHGGEITATRGKDHLKARFSAGFEAILLNLSLPQA